MPEKYLPGKIPSHPWDSDQVLIEYIIECENQDETESIYVRSDNINGIICEVIYPDGWDGSTRAEVNFHVKIPESTVLNLVMQTINGCISLSNGMGTSLVEVINGSAVLEEFTGELTVNVVNGEIDLNHVHGLSIANIVNGTIRGTIDVVEHDINISTVSGLVDLIIEGSTSVTVTTMSGDIDIPDVEVRHDLVGSSAEFGEGEFKINIITVSGDIRIRY